jgi:hypothetical protein
LTQRLRKERIKILEGRKEGKGHEGRWEGKEVKDNRKARSRKEGEY